jgi:hypothetical protein
MPKVTFTERFDYRPTPNIWITYQPGAYDGVKREAIEQATAQGKVATARTRKASPK